VSSRLGRLCGALLLQTSERGAPAWFVIGDTKVPCDWTAAGFVAPDERDVRRTPTVQLRVCGAPQLRGTVLALQLGGASAAALVAERLLVERNGSVSERLWRLITGEPAATCVSTAERTIDAAWLGQMPRPIWDVVRQAVLTCS
jgi:hypothetical protein